MNAPVGKILENVVDEMLEGMQVIDRAWRYIYVNQTVAEQGRSTKEALMGRTMMECYPGIEKTDLFAQLTKCMEERVSIHMENEFTYPDGSKGWFLLYLHPVEDGILILSTDITERKRAEAALNGKIEEMERLMHLTVEREARMIQLKDMVAQLKKLAPPAVRLPVVIGE